MEHEFESFPLSDSLDNLILMHRDAHFGGSFDVMLDYYRKEGKGICPDFSIERIEELADSEKRMGQNLSSILLSGAEAERIANAKEAYKKLKGLYENPTSKQKYPLLIADLILAEEELPEKEIEAIIQEKEAIVPSLLELLRADDFYDPLFPGYGLAPILAAKCLGRIGDKRAIIALFESIGGERFFDEDIALEALKEIGEPAKQFLLKVLHGRPITYDNERAAIALIEFKENPEVAEICFKMLKEIDVRMHLPLATYLVLACEGLPQSYRKEFLDMIKEGKLPKSLLQDMKSIAANWQK